MAANLKKSEYENWTRKKVSIASLFLDSENIRLGFEVQKSQQEAIINDLFVNEKAIDVLESIAKNGFFPDELPVVVEESGKMIVMEGNRRVASLKVMIQPEIVPSKLEKIKNILKTAIAPIKTIEVVVAPNRDSVRKFLASKHTQTTRRPWKPLRQAYFYRAELERGKTVQNLRDEYPTVDIGKFLRMINVHQISKSIAYDDEDVTKKVHNDRSFPISTMERLYDDRSVRSFLGFDFDGDGELKINIHKSEFEKGFKKIVQDVVNKVVDSRSLNDEKGRKRYLLSFSKEETPNKKTSGNTTTSKDFKPINPIFVRKRKKLAPTDIVFTSYSKGVLRMLMELQTIDYHKYPNATHDLLRSFLECSLKAYFRQTKVTVAPKNGKYVTLEDVLTKIKDEFSANNNKELLQVVGIVTSRKKILSYSKEFLDGVNHNPSIFVVPEDVEDAWDKLDPLLRYVLNPKKK